MCVCVCALSEMKRRNSLHWILFNSCFFLECNNMWIVHAKLNFEKGKTKNHKIPVEHVRLFSVHKASRFSHSFPFLPYFPFFFFVCQFKVVQFRINSKNERQMITHPTAMKHNKWSIANNWRKSKEKEREWGSEKKYHKKRYILSSNCFRTMTWKKKK